MSIDCIYNVYNYSEICIYMQNNTEPFKQHSAEFVVFNLTEQYLTVAYYLKSKGKCSLLLLGIPCRQVNNAYIKHAFSSRVYTTCWIERSCNGTQSRFTIYFLHAIINFSLY